MASFQDGYSTMLCDDVSRLNDQDMRLTVRPKVEPVSDNEVESSVSELKSPFICTICSKSFLRKGNLKHHLTIHSGERPFMCDICQKAFSRKTVLNRHKLSHMGLTVRPKVEPLSDNEAESFSSELKKQNPSYMCTICSKSFLRKDSLKRHLIIHSGEQSPSYTCTICSKSFLRKDALKRHSIIHSGERSQKSSYMCTICSKSFLRKDTLKRHLIIHSGERPFMCDICQKAFFRNSNLNRHKLSHMRLTVRIKP